MKKNKIKIKRVHVLAAVAVVMLGTAAMVMSLGDSFQGRMRVNNVSTYNKATTSRTTSSSPVVSLAKLTPIVTIRKPTDQQYVTGKHLSIEIMAGTNEGSQLVKVEFYDGNVKVATLPISHQGLYNYSLDISNKPSNVPQEASVRVYNADGYIGKKTVKYFIDNTAPTINISAPVVGQKFIWGPVMRNINVIWVNVDSEDLSGVKNLYFKTNGEFGALTDASTYSFNAKAVLGGEWGGTRTVVVQATDKYNNQSQKTVTFRMPPKPGSVKEAELGIITVESIN